MVNGFSDLTDHIAVSYFSFDEVSSITTTLLYVDELQLSKEEFQ